jgi:protein phosphatase
MEQTQLPVALGFKTDVGRIRDTNQDSYGVMRRADLLNRLDALMVVADGMGGGRGGEVASKIAAETISEVTLEFISNQAEGRPVEVARLMRSALIRANTNVRARQFEQPELRGMGTTCVAAILQNNQLTIGNAGDSRGYLLREGKLSQLTDDHSEVWEQVKAGNMTREQARRSRHRNVITRAIGIQTDLDPDVDTFSLLPGDTVLLCSDGLTTEVSDTEIARILASAPTAQEACDRLVGAALRKGGSDNITVVALRYGDFVPLTLAETDAQTSDANGMQMVENEDDTDPNPIWRSGNANRAPQIIARASDRILEEETEPPEEPTRPSSRRFSSRRREEQSEEAEQGSLTFANVLILFLFLLIVAQSVALYIALANRSVQIVAAPAQNLEMRTKAEQELDERSLKDLRYEGPEIFYAKPVRDGFLMLDKQLAEHLLVVSQEGKLLRIGPDGKATALPGPTLPAPAPADPKQKPPLLFALDQNGNRYQVDPKNQSIVKYDPLGERKGEYCTRSIKSPTALVVDRRGDLFLIQERRLQKITSYETTEQLKADQEQRKEQQETP